MTNLAIAESKTERIEKIKQQLKCSGCGAVAEASCNCGVGYVPAGEYAAKAIAAHPEMSDNAIAKEIGVDQTTVSRARKTVKGKALTARRIGKDGKSYTAKKPAAKPAKAPTTAVASPIGEMQPEPTALLLSEIERLVDDLAMAINGVRFEIFDGRVRAVADRLLALIAKPNGKGE
jgi:hypothetical protein